MRLTVDGRAIERHGNTLRLLVPGDRYITPPLEVTKAELALTLSDHPLWLPEVRIDCRFDHVTIYLRAQPWLVVPKDKWVELCR